MEIYVVSNPYNDYGTIYGIFDDLDKAIECAYAAMVSSTKSNIKFDRFVTKEHYIDWIVLLEMNKWYGC